MLGSNMLKPTIKMEDGTTYKVEIAHPMVQLTVDGVTETGMNSAVTFEVPKMCYNIKKEPEDPEEAEEEASAVGVSPPYTVTNTDISIEIVKIERDACETDTTVPGKPDPYTQESCENSSRRKLENNEDTQFASDYKIRIDPASNKNESDTCMKCIVDKQVCIHSGKKLFQCNDCQKCFSHRGNLMTHVRIHTDEKPYQCNVCTKRFKRNGDLKVHTRIHTVEKPYQCKLCVKSFKQRSHLDVHTRTHTGEKPFQCHICQKYFSLKIRLKEHILIHTGEKPYKCDICMKRFSRKSSLNQHSRTHTGEKRFQCNVCLKCFKQSAHLECHARIHTGEKPFQCNVCNRYFSQKANLLRHIVLHTARQIVIKTDPKRVRANPP